MGLGEELPAGVAVVDPIANASLGIENAQLILGPAMAPVAARWKRCSYARMSAKNLHVVHPSASDDPMLNAVDCEGFNLELFFG